MKLKIFTTGGTIDKTYFDAKDNYEVGEPIISSIFEEARVDFPFEVQQLCRKDSLEMSDDDRRMIREAVMAEECDHVLITHGTDTMADTAEALEGIPGKVVVLTGALNPARFRSSDAIFNIGSAVAATQTMPPGVYIAMNGRVFQAGHVRKNREANRFEAV